MRKLSESEGAEMEIVVELHEDPHEQVSYDDAVPCRANLLGPVP